MRDTPRTIHFQIQVTVNENDYQWRDPIVRKDLNFQIPFEMFSSKLFSTMVEKLVEAANAEFPDVVKEFEAKEEAERLAQEANVVLEPAN